eukprot:2909712-Pyramimonas_sp.AAC.1
MTGRCAGLARPTNVHGLTFCTVTLSSQRQPGPTTATSPTAGAQSNPEVGARRRKSRHARGHQFATTGRDTAVRAGE